MLQQDSPGEAAERPSWRHGVPGAYRVAETGSLRNMSRSQSRGRGSGGGSAERGARVAETGTLRSRGSSVVQDGLPATAEEDARVLDSGTRSVL
jgi:hypothetical protein